jgi:valyl-tRNA synthetase
MAAANDATPVTYTIDSQRHSVNERSVYSKAATTLGLLFGIIVAVKILLAAIGAIDSIILISPLLKLIGVGYTVWFLSRNALFASDRQRFGVGIASWIKQIIGQLAESFEPLPAPSSTDSLTSGSPVADSTPSASLSEISSKSQEQMFAGVVGTVQVLIPLAGVVDIEALKAKIQKDLSKVEAEVQSLTQRLSNPKFVDKAPTNVVQGARDALAEAEKQADILKERLARL